MIKYQRAYFPSKKVSLSQGYGLFSYSHQHTYALDLGGSQKLFAPFDCIVKKVYAPKKKNGELDISHSFEVWLVSKNSVLCANGYYGKITITITHPKGISKLKVGQEFKQGASLGIDTSEMTGVKTGSHYHLEVGLGVQSGWDANIIKKYGKYVIPNAVPPQEYLFVEDTATIGNTKYKLKNYKFIKEKDITYKVKGVPSEPLIIRSLPWPSGKKIGELKNGNDVIKFNNKALVYHYGILGYTSNKYLKK